MDYLYCQQCENILIDSFCVNLNCSGYKPIKLREHVIQLHQQIKLLKSKKENTIPNQEEREILYTIEEYLEGLIDCDNNVPNEEMTLLTRLQQYIKETN